MKFRQQAFVPDEEADLARKDMDSIPDLTFVSLFPESHTAAKLLGKIQGIQKKHLGR